MEAKTIEDRRGLMIEIAKGICDAQNIRYKNSKLDFPKNGDIPPFTVFFDKEGNITKITE